MLDAWVKKYLDEQTASCASRPADANGAALALCLGMPILLTNKQALSAVELGCCIAIGTADYVIGHAFPGALSVEPPADLRTYPGPDGFMYVEALTADGAAFLALVRSSG